MNHLSRHQVDQIRRALQERERTLLKEIREGMLRTEEDRHKDIAGVVSDTGDESVADLLVDVGIVAVDRDARELREVQDALGRILHGTYGACADCGGEIPWGRLLASPSATRCASCADRYEQAHGRRTPSI